jgi:hypothetical protein
MRITYKSIIGKHILVGITVLNNNDEVVSSFELHGIIEYAQKNDKISIRLKNNDLNLETDENGYYNLPPDLSAISVAGEGIYTLHFNGEKVENPDLLASWDVVQPE